MLIASQGLHSLALIQKGMWMQGQQRCNPIELRAHIEIEIALKLTG
jgi:hypothetical protein